MIDGLMGMLMKAKSTTENFYVRAPRQWMQSLNHPIFFLLLLSVSIFHVSVVHGAETTQRTAQTVLHMLDYVSVDYGGAVILERVLNENEYKEQTEFARQVVILLNELPSNSHLDVLIAQGDMLAALVKRKAAVEEVSTLAKQLRHEIIQTYRVPISPKQLPDLKLAETIFKNVCSRCHGEKGYGDGVESHKYNPRPANFHDDTRMWRRSVYGLYNTITLGVPGTEMKAMNQLTDDERWSMAFYVATLGDSAEYIEVGRQLWGKRLYLGPSPNLLMLSSLSSSEVAIQYGEQARSVFAYLRANPSALQRKHNATLLFSASQLDQAFKYYQDGNQTQALQMSVAAYLEGFEPMEVSLDHLNAELRRDIELKMMLIRRMVMAGVAVDELEKQVISTKLLLLQADELLRSGGLSIAGAFASALLVLLHEGIEGMLILVVMITFLIKNEMRKALVPIHLGWVSALILGILTAMAASWLIDISGMWREIVHSVTALITSALLVYVGYWLHSKARLQPSQVSSGFHAVMETKVIWIFVLLSFVAVYREIFEAVIFYQAIWMQVNEVAKMALWSGIMVAILLLIMGGWTLFHFGRKLPLKQFSSSASWLLGLLAVVMVGQGIEALQEVSIISANTIEFISFPLLGLHSTTQTLFAQIGVILVLALCYRAPRAA